MDKSHRPLSKHPNANTDEELTKIKNLIKRNPHIGLNELYSKLRVEINYSRHYASLYRVLRKTGFYKSLIKPKKKYVTKPYNTPTLLGEKMQMNVKYIPKSCATSAVMSDDKFYQYTIIDEVTRERFIYAYK